MYSFVNDYSETAHPRLLDALQQTNNEQFTGYGLDQCSAAAADCIRAACKRPDLEVHFLSGGTQTNLTAIASMLRPYQAVLSAECGHINTHETGSIEACGHKVYPLPSPNGKLLPEQLREAVTFHYFDQMVQPKLVYISDSTEFGAVYRRSELIALREACLELGLYLFVDGARLGAALTAPQNDLSLSDLAALTDAFYIGGTKNGALFGEAYVIVNPLLRENFRFHMRQRGALLAKGWVIGLQFQELFRDGLYFELARAANEQAARLSAGFEAKGYRLAVPTESNQIFPVLNRETMDRLRQDFNFMEWEPKPGDRAVCRFVTSWATQAQQVDNLIDAL